MSVKVGTAGEHLVCFDAFYQNYSATIVHGQLTYDIILADNGKEYKIQVKTSTCTTTEGRSFHYVLKYTKNMSLHGGYKAKEVDLFAFVNPDLRKVAYIPYKKVFSNWKVTIQTSEYDLHNLQTALDYLSSPSKIL